jgi:hypothetical protein
MKLTLRNVGSTISILFCIGGAFNVGMSGIFLATPFMFFLCFINSVTFRSFFASLAFIVACAFINKNIYTNSFVYPILKNGVEMVVTRDNLFLTYESGSGLFLEPGSAILNNVIQAEKKEILNDFLKDNARSFMKITDGSYNRQLIKFKKDQKIKIKGVYNFGGIDSENSNYIVTEFGRVSEDEVEKGNLKIIPDNPVQSKWSVYLGNLMYWPALPLALLSIFH